MTEGKVWKNLLNLAIPMFFSSVFTQAYSVVDSVIVGRYVGASALAAVGVNSQIILLTVSLGVGFLLGVSTVVGEHCGADRWDQVRQVEVIGIFVTMGTFLMKVFVAVFLARPILCLIHTPEEILEDAILYLRIIFIGGLFSYANSMLVYILRACGDGVRPLLFQIFSSIVNIILDVVFVRYLEWGVAGAAAATVASEAMAVIVSLIYLKRKMPQIWLNWEDVQDVKRELVHSVIRLAIPASVDMSAVTICTIFVQSVINRYGTMVVAGYTAALKLDTTMLLAVYAMADALSAFVAQNRGAARFDRIEEGRRIALLQSVIFAGAVSVVVWCFGKNLLHIFVTEGDYAVVEEGYFYLQITCVFYIVMTLEHIYSGVLRGMADAVAPLITGGMQVAANLSAIFLLEPLFGKAGIWMSVPISWCLCFLGVTIRAKQFRRKQHVRF